MQSHDPIAAIKGAVIINTYTLTSMGREDKALKRCEDFAPCHVNGKLVDLATKDIIAMHYLPAHRGVEITDKIADGSQTGISQQANNRLPAQMAILVKLFSSL
jgi:ornithine carbamoyltransferase